MMSGVFVNEKSSHCASPASSEVVKEVVLGICLLNMLFHLFVGKLAMSKIIGTTRSISMVGFFFF